ncbi:hypothetical protein Tco_0183099 [Tanacetum coccineum]
MCLKNLTLNLLESSRRVIKKKVSISLVDNVIHEPDVALELGKSMSLTKAAEEEATRHVHATHERIVTESNPSQLEEDHKDIRGPDESIGILSTSSKGTSTKPGVSDEEKDTSAAKAGVTFDWGL